MQEPDYSLPNIRELLLEGFNDRELRYLCYDVPDFRPVYNELGPNTGKAEIVHMLLAHAEQQLLMDALLALAKRLNSARYAKHGPYYTGDPVPPLQRGITALSRRHMIMLSSLCTFYAPAKAAVLAKRLSDIANVLYEIYEMRAHDDTTGHLFNLHELSNLQADLETALKSLSPEHFCALVCLSNLDHVTAWEASVRHICESTTRFNTDTEDVTSEEYRELRAALSQVRKWQVMVGEKRQSARREMMEVEDWLSDTPDHVRSLTKAPSPNAELKTARQQAGLTQAALAQKVGVSRTSISRWEREGVVPRSAEARKRTSEVLDCPLWPEDTADSL
jgi:DNA-binding XRE family transcriptional regulator